ncbi:siderophore-interacting protein [Psychrobacter sp. AOP7-B1-25]|uniref:siderophore-interacting protein n=1 Tax=Psychrobacter sp. AOP7-B1-25 TaxID=3457644 RepID=UPI00402B6475
MNNTTNQKPVREIMTVDHKQMITPHYIRIYLTGQADTIANIATMTVGANNKVLIPVDKAQSIDLNDNTTFVVRTYTHRGADVAKQQIWIDFVAHGDEAPASGWATHAEVGDEIGILMKPKTKALCPDADNFLLIGDATAIPVLGSILETLPASSTGQCIIEVHGAEDEQELSTAANITMTWLHNPDPTQGSQLIDTVKSLDLPTAEQSRFAYIASEFSSVKALRHYLKVEQQWSKDELYAFSYWKAGVAEDQSVSDRQAEKNTD